MEKTDKIILIMIVYIFCMILIIKFSEKYSSNEPYNHCNRQLRFVTPNELKSC